MKVRRNFVHICLLSAMLLQATTSGAQPVTKIAAGLYRSLLLKSDGNLWVIGYIGPGQMEADDAANNKTNQPPQPPQLVASNVTAVAAGAYHTLFLKSNGSLWAVGENRFGQLGDVTYNGTPDSTYNNTNPPEQIVASNVTAIAAGHQFSLFLKSNGSLWAMGWNNDGQLGDGTSGAYAKTNRPEQIVPSNVMAIAAGGVHSLFLKSDGSLWAMGYNINGQLGNGTYGKYDQAGANRPEQIVASNVTAIAAGDMHSLFLKNDGSLWAMGNNAEGQLGDGHCNNNPNRPELIVASNVTAIAAGEWHSLFLKSDGSLWTMGRNVFGQLGDGSSGVNAGSKRPKQIVASNVTAIAGGSEHSLFLKSDGSLWAMGWNKYGQLGDGTTNNTNRPKQIVTDPTLNNFWRIRSSP
jgi:alpha-tubulin suppressor-like RCC1 family protein